MYVHFVIPALMKVGTMHVLPDFLLFLILVEDAGNHYHLLSYYVWHRLSQVTQLCPFGIS